MDSDISYEFPIANNATGKKRYLFVVFSVKHDPETTWLSRVIQTSHWP